MALSTAGGFYLTVSLLLLAVLWSVSGACPGEGPCIYDFDTDYLFSESRDLCNTRNASLITLPANLAEHQQMYYYLSELELVTKYPIWLDCSYTDGVWRCAGGLNFYCDGCQNNTGYWNWKDIPNADELCLEYRKDGLIEAEKCTSKRNVVCTITNLRQDAPPQLPIKRSVMFHQIPGFCPMRGVFKSIFNSNSPSRCAIRCEQSRDVDCMSFNWIPLQIHGTGGVCQLNDSKANVSSSVDRYEGSTCRYYERPTV